MMYSERCQISLSGYLFSCPVGAGPQRGWHVQKDRFFPPKTQCSITVNAPQISSRTEQFRTLDNTWSFSLTHSQLKLDPGEELQHNLSCVTGVKLSQVLTLDMPVHCSHQVRNQAQSGTRRRVSRSWLSRSRGVCAVSVCGETARWRLWGVMCSPTESLVQVQHPFLLEKPKPHVLVARKVDQKEPGGSQSSRGGIWVQRSELQRFTGSAWQKWQNHECVTSVCLIETGVFIFPQNSSVLAHFL